VHESVDQGQEQQMEDWMGYEVMEKNNSDEFSKNAGCSSSLTSHDRLWIMDGYLLPSDLHHFAGSSSCGIGIIDTTLYVNARSPRLVIPLSLVCASPWLLKSAF